MCELIYVVGLIISNRFITISVAHLTLQHYVVWSAVLLFAGVAIFYALLLFGVDPFWSFHLAKRWCAQPDWVHLNTSLLYALVRDSASLIGKTNCAVLHKCTNLFRETSLEISCWLEIFGLWCSYLILLRLSCHQKLTAIGVSVETCERSRSGTISACCSTFISDFCSPFLSCSVAPPKTTTHLYKLWTFSLCSLGSGFCFFLVLVWHWQLLA